MKKSYKGVWIPEEFIIDDMSWLKRILLAEISQLETLDNGCTASNNHFAKKYKITPQGVSKALNELKDDGYIYIDDAQTKRNFGRKIFVKGERFNNYDPLNNPINSGKSPINSGKSPINSGKSPINSGLESKGREQYREKYSNIGDIFFSVFPKMLIDDEKFIDAWNNFEEIRKKHKCSSTSTAYERLLNQLIEISNYDVSTATSIVWQSYDSGWTKLYPIKKAK